MTTNLETLERILLRDALRKKDPEALAKIDAELIEFASKGTMQIELEKDG